MSETALRVGARLGPYEIRGLIGIGGMGEVYRAVDTSLGREVALKVLPAAFAQDADRLARFEREAKTLATLNHPNIAAIYGIEQSGDAYAIVMELVEGSSLADRMAHGAVPLDEALPMARQIAEALEVAHERGIVHRDLKPPNVRIRTDGTVKVLDFGLAKTVESSTALEGASQSPTITTPAMTGLGTILGTAAYMSPEQARGALVDKRADVWAFGVVLYELLTGRRLVDEANVSDALAVVLKGELRLDALPATTPAAVRQLIARCLTRDVRQRLRDIGEARIAIERAIAHPAGATPHDPVPRAPVASPFWQRALPWTIAIVALAAAGAALWFTRGTATQAGSVMRLTLDPAGDLTLPLPSAQGASVVLLSPDGRRLAIVGSPAGGGRARLYVRRLDELQAAPLQGTEGARNPFFSPDGLSIGFFADGKLKRISVNGGVALTLCDAPDDRGGSWGDGWIAFTPRPGDSAIFRVSQDGGSPAPLTTLAPGEVTHRWPQILPGGRAVLYTANAATGNYDQANIVVQPLGGGSAKVVHQGGSYGRYLPAGHLVYVSQGGLFAAPFDVERLVTTAQAVPVVPGVASAPVTGGAQFSFSNDGSFAYVPGAGEAVNQSIYWAGPDARTEPLRAVPAAYGNVLRFSPDGERLAVSIRDQQSDLWMYEWRRDILSRLTSHPALDADPVWTPDGKRIAFRSTRDGTDHLFWQRSDGSDQAQRLTTEGRNGGVWPMSWHPGGRLLAFREIGRDTGQDIWILPLEGDAASGWKPGKPSLLIGGPSNETDAAFSPDGRWVAFQSDESGKNEVYVRAFPGAGARIRVSASGGLSPRWSPKGQKLFYRTDDGKIFVATYSASGDSFRADKPSVWSEGPVVAFDVHPDGQRLAVLKTAATQQPTSSRFVLILNFFEELRRVSK
jgi:Tol biopolymer transport system component